MKYKVAVVDDEPEFLEELSSLLQKYSQLKGGETQFVTDLYQNGDELLKGNPAVYEMIFLDINMPGTNGLRVAKKVREKNAGAVIIFCTHYAQYAVNGYEVNALGYILKPLEEKSFNRNLDRALKILTSNQLRNIRIKTLHGIEVVDVADILYLEIQIHNLYYYVLTEDGGVKDYRTRGSMQEMTESLGELGFARCSACYLVNLRHVTSMQNGEVRLRGGVCSL